MVAPGGDRYGNFQLSVTSMWPAGDPDGLLSSNTPEATDRQGPVWLTIRRRAGNGSGGTTVVWQPDVCWLPCCPEPSAEVSPG